MPADLFKDQAGPDFPMGAVKAVVDDHRLRIKIVVANMPVMAIIDTGAPNCVLDPEIAEEACVEFEAASSLMIRGETYEGRVGAVAIRIEADRGEHLEVNVRVFVPDTDDALDWNLPNFVGMTGCLSRFNWAFTRGADGDWFYFGE